MGETYSNGRDTEVLGRGKNTSKATPIIYKPTRTVDEIDEEIRLEKIAEKVGLMNGETMEEGIPLKEMEELSKYKDPISVWISRKRAMRKHFID